MFEGKIINTFLSRQSSRHPKFLLLVVFHTRSWIWYVGTVTPVKRLLSWHMKSDEPDTHIPLSGFRCRSYIYFWPCQLLTWTIRSLNKQLQA